MLKELKQKLSEVSNIIDSDTIYKNVKGMSESKRIVSPCDIQETSVMNISDLKCQRTTITTQEKEEKLKNEINKINSITDSIDIDILNSPNALISDTCAQEFKDGLSTAVNKIISDISAINDVGTKIQILLPRFIALQWLYVYNDNILKKYNNNSKLNLSTDSKLLGKFIINEDYAGDIEITNPNKDLGNINEIMSYSFVGIMEIGDIGIGDNTLLANFFKEIKINNPESALADVEFEQLQRLANINMSVNKRNAAASSIDDIQGLVLFQQQLSSKIIEIFKSLKMFYERKINLNQLKNIEVCGGKKLLKDIDFDKKPVTSADFLDSYDANKRNFSDPGKAGMMDLDYWNIYALNLTTVSLLPQYWAKGIIVPTPAGPQYLPCPIIWIALAVIPTPTSLMVLFLTINGMLPFPVLWELKFPPSGNNESTAITTLRGQQQIKIDTGNKVLNEPIINNIDINPDLMKSLPYAKADLPIIEQLFPVNPPYFLYLNVWASKVKNGMGFIP